MMIRHKLARFAAAAAAAALTLPTWADESYPGSGWGQLNMPRGVTDISRKIYDLHMTIFWLCVGIGIVVFGVDDLLDGHLPQVQGRGRRYHSWLTARGSRSSGPPSR